MGREDRKGRKQRWGEEGPEEKGINVESKFVGVIFIEVLVLARDWAMFWGQNGCIN